MNTTLPTDSEERKRVPLVSGCLDYFPAALAGVARISYAGNQKHNPGQPLHHARGKSTDHADCVLRHLVDLQGLLAQRAPCGLATFNVADVLAEASALAWRALALSQELHERFGAPLAPGARLPEAPLVAAVSNRPGVQEPAEEFDGSKRVVLPASAAPVEPKPLQLEVGKRYMRRNGKLSGILSDNDQSVFPFSDEMDSYTEFGRCYWTTESEFDLISEYTGS